MLNSRLAASPRCLAAGSQAITDALKQIGLGCFEIK